MQSRPNSTRFPQSTDTVPEIPSPFPQTAPSSTPRSRRCCSAEVIPGGNRDHEHSDYRNGREAAAVGGAARAIGAIEPSWRRARAQPLRRHRIFGPLIWLVSSTWGVLWALPLIVVQGYFVAFLFMVVHETAHKTAFRNRAFNLALGHLSSFAIGLPYEYYCLFHWDHHRYTQDPDRDPELLVGPMPASDTQLAIAYTGLRQVGFRVGL